MSQRYSRIPNVVLDALCRVSLTQYETRILLYVCRKTFGWNARYVRFRPLAAAEFTDVSRPHVYRTVNSLLAKSILLEGRDERGKKGLTVNLNTDAWLTALPSAQSELDFDAGGAMADMKLVKGE